MKQVEAARRLGVAPVTLWRWGSGLRTPVGASLYAMARLYNKPVEWFYIEEEERTGQTGEGAQGRQIAEAPARYPVTDIGGFARDQDRITLASVSIIGAISAGGLVEGWQTDLGQAEVPAQVIRAAPRAFALRVSSNSLLPDGIFDGDIVVVDPDAGLVDGRIYAVRSEENNQTIAARKVYTAGPRRYKLVSGDGSVVEVEASKTELLGRIRWSFSFREH